MQVTCPEGHTIEIADPPVGPVLVGVVDGREVFGPYRHPLGEDGRPALVAKCNAMVVRNDADGNPGNVQCGAMFNALEEA